MGTAGAIKLAEDVLSDDNFFMINGDIILDFEFSQMLNAHHKSQELGLVGSKIVNDPSRYGVLIVDEKTNKIANFLEKDDYKPSKGKVVPMPINAGVYLLEPEIFSYIEPKKKMSIERDLFPTLAKEGNLFYFPIPGIWRDIGKPEELLQGNFQLLASILDKSIEQKKNLIDDTLDIDGKALIYPPVAIGENVIIQENCRIGPNVIIGDNVYIGENAEIKESIIYRETYISNNVKIEKAIISDNCLIQDGVEMKGRNKNLVILGSHVRVTENLKLISPSNGSISICHHEVIRDNIEMS
jgi:NDP-sugar pyrophosphorylase family protein